MNRPTITMTLSVDETNILLEGLGHVPFARAFQLVDKIQNAATEQLADPESDIDSEQESVPAVVKELASAAP